MLFEQKVPARKFRTTDVNVFEENVDGGVLTGYKTTLRERRVTEAQEG
jgi:hypothetical protein